MYIFLLKFRCFHLYYSFYQSKSNKSDVFSFIHIDKYPVNSRNMHLQLSRWFTHTFLTPNKDPRIQGLGSGDIHTDMSQVIYSQREKRTARTVQADGIKAFGNYARIIRFDLHALHIGRSARLFIMLGQPHGDGFPAERLHAHKGAPNVAADLLQHTFYCTAQGFSRRSLLFRYLSGKSR